MGSHGSFFSGTYPAPTSVKEAMDAQLSERLMRPSDTAGVSISTPPFDIPRVGASSAVSIGTEMGVRMLSTPTPRESAAGAVPSSPDPDALAGLDELAVGVPS